MSYAEQDGSAGKGVCWQTWEHEVDPPETRGSRRVTPASCLLTCLCACTGACSCPALLTKWKTNQERYTLLKHEALALFMWLHQGVKSIDKEWQLYSHIAFRFFTTDTNLCILKECENRIYKQQLGSGLSLQIRVRWSITTHICIVTHFLY